MDVAPNQTQRERFPPLSWSFPFTHWTVKVGFVGQVSGLILKGLRCVLLSCILEHRCLLYKGIGKSEVWKSRDYKTSVNTSHLDPPQFLTKSLWPGAQTIPVHSPDNWCVYSTWKVNSPDFFRLFSFSVPYHRRAKFSFSFSFSSSHPGLFCSESEGLTLLGWSRICSYFIVASWEATYCLGHWGWQQQCQNFTQ